MNVTISVFGRFHAFNLAHQLSQRGHLNRLITSYPSFEAGNYGVPKEYVKSLPHLELLKRGWSRVSPWVPFDGGDFLVNRGFEWNAAQHIPDDTDVFVGWSGAAERGLRKAKKLGAVAVLERGSGHIEHQRDLLREEGERFGVEVRLPGSQVVEKEKREYERAEAIVVPSRFAKKSFCEYGVDETKLVRIPYGVDLDEFRKVKKKDDIFRVIYAGRMSLQKGVHYLLKAFSELELPDAELWLVGKKRPDIIPFFEKYKEWYRHLGHKPQNQLFEYYSQGSVFVLNSVQDGFGMVIPQAMACGLPAICTEHTGGPDIIRDGTDGFVIPPCATEELKKKLLRCYENRGECREMGRKAQARVRHSFRWGDYGDRVVESYSHFLQG